MKHDEEDEEEDEDFAESEDDDEDDDPGKLRLHHPIINISLLYSC